MGRVALKQSAPLLLFMKAGELMEEKNKGGSGSKIAMGSRAARDIRTLNNAAANAASGNVIGAAVEVAKNPKIFTRIIAVILLACFLLLMCIMSIPSMMWSVVEGVIASLGDIWDNSAGTTGNHLTDAALQVFNFIGGVTKSLGDTIKNLFADAWGSFTGFIFGNEDNENEDLVASESGVLTGLEEDAQKENFEDICTRTSKRYLDRYYDLLDEIKKDSAIRSLMYDDYTLTIVTPYPSVQQISWIDMLLSPIESKKKYESFYNQTMRAAVEILSAYTVQRSGSIGYDVKWSEYSDWLGARNVDGFASFGLDKYRVDGWLTDCVRWQGTFMTQPDYERMMHDMEKEKQASSAPESFDEEKWLDDHLADYKDQQESVLNRFLKHDPNGPDIVEWTTTDTQGNVTTHCRATYTIMKADVSDVGQDVMEFQEGVRTKEYDESIFTGTGDDSEG